jgi:hypothetical protein
VGLAIEGEWRREVVDDEGSENASARCYRVVELERPAECTDGARRFGLELIG